MEDYKKKYEEAMLRMNKWVEGSEIIDPKEVAEFVFPELKDSEDMRIREALKSFFDYGNVEWKNGIKYSEIVAWLEKQGKESVVTDVLVKAGLKPYKDGNKWCILVGDNIQDGICGFGDTVDEALFEFLKELTEKAGEQKPNDKIQIGKVYKCIASPRYTTFMIGKVYKPEDKFICSLMNFCSDCFELIETGQKPVDKVEPKFHEGEWITIKE